MSFHASVSHFTIGSGSLCVLLNVVLPQCTYIYCIINYVCPMSSKFPLQSGLIKFSKFMNHRIFLVVPYPLQTYVLLIPTV